MTRQANETLLTLRAEMAIGLSACAALGEVGAKFTCSLVAIGPLEQFWFDWNRNNLPMSFPRRRESSFLIGTPGCPAEFILGPRFARTRGAGMTILCFVPFQSNSS